MPTDTTTSVSNWDFHNFHVQEELTGGEFINAESTLICAGPPTLALQSGIGGESVYPIGLVENMGISQSKQLQRIFEIGSSRSYFVPGRVVGSLSMGRVIFNGHSLLRVKYAWMDLDSALFDPSIESDVLAALPHASVTDEPISGHDGAVFNLNSAIFNQPYGLTMIMKDQLENDWAQIYLENCYVQGHQFSVSSGSSLLLEAATSQFDRLMPVKVQA